ncbi:hypothetical protein PR202_ga12430 [Eleusine coracana subsp. coracana]|uniref:Amino acid transporter transmembrane domain-containing protein n=1 Tax=Eleusine coracana subsp. coracana TaxID=191504 RepID=A0AAV5CC68_ELECO|nr:hypothetical protein PR202_ga12430 [Eleusine coracana subsp. coracana]
MATMAAAEQGESELVSLPATPEGATTPTGRSKQDGSGPGTPARRVVEGLRGYLEDVGHLTRLDPRDAWLPVTESRGGNARYAAFHSLNAGLGFQALLLPLAFPALGWSWGIVSLIIAYFWQLYTLWILVKLHEAVPGRRYNRYMELAQAAFGEKLGLLLALFPTIYLSAGTATALILVGGETMKLFFQIVCGPHCSPSPISTVECQSRPPTISYEPVTSTSFGTSLFATLNALGIIAFAFRGHNLSLEIQMSQGGMLTALYAFHSQDIPRGILATTFLLVVLNCLSSFQIYSMPVFDSFEAYYTGRTNRPCSSWVRSGFRVFYGFISLFISVALPFLSSLAGLLGGLTLPVTFAYPCFMWIRLKKPERFTFAWYLNWGLGLLGTAFSLAFSLAGIWSIVSSGMNFRFFKPS